MGCNFSSTVLKAVDLPACCVYQEGKIKQCPRTRAHVLLHSSSRAHGKQSGIRPATHALPWCKRQLPNLEVCPSWQMWYWTVMQSHWTVLSASGKTNIDNYTRWAFIQTSKLRCQVKSFLFCVFNSWRSMEPSNPWEPIFVQHIRWLVWPWRRINSCVLVKEQCLVLFPYTAQNEDELTLEEGQTILIIR